MGQFRLGFCSNRILFAFREGRTALLIRIIKLPRQMLSQGGNYFNRKGKNPLTTGFYPSIGLAIEGGYEGILGTKISIS